jgi:hypothetical protein
MRAATGQRSRKSRPGIARASSSSAWRWKKWIRQGEIRCPAVAGRRGYSPCKLRGEDSGFEFGDQAAGVLVDTYPTLVS